MARKYGTSDGVIRAFVRDESHPYTNSSGSVTQEKDILYSYLEPIAVQRHDGLIVVNGDKWSVTTNKHQSELQMIVYLRNHFTASFSAIAQFVEMPRRMMAQRLRDGKIEVLSHTEDFIAYYVRKENVFKSKGHIYKMEDLPAGVEIRYSKDEFGNFQPSVAHMAASCLLKYENRYGLASMDEQSYFCSILSRPAETVSDAFYSLKPEETVEAERKGLEIFRQGEWFFIPHLIGKEAREQYNQMETIFKLVGRNGGNPHIATRGVWLDEQRGIAEVSGQIRHDEHRMLQLSTSDDPVIYVAVENTAVRSFSAMGRVD